MFTKPMCSFRLRFFSLPADGGGTPPVTEPAFPADTAPEEMTPEQQLAFYRSDAEKWKGLSRKHEKRAKPVDYDDLAADAQKWRQQSDDKLPPDAKAINAARSEGRIEGVQSLLHDSVRAELKAHRPHMTTEALDEFLEDVALDKFLGQDGRLDTERVERLAGKLAAPPSTTEGDTPPAPEPPVGGALLGHVLKHTTAPPAGSAGSVADYRAREKARYESTNTK